MNRTACLVGLFALAGPLALSAGCTDDSNPNPGVQAPDQGDGGDAGGQIALLGEPATPCADAAAALYGDPGSVPAYDRAQRGAIVKCTKDPALSKEDLQAKLTALGYKGKALTSGANVYRVLYRTERGDAANTPGFSSAIVYVPTAPRANDLPIVVGARGSRGQAAACAASKLEPTLGVNDDLFRLAYPLVGSGYAVIVPDLAGYANYGATGNPPSVYAGVDDVGKSTLDGSRALKKLYPSLADKTVIVGHSQGGHSALSALSLADAYGAQGSIVGVATYAPLWLSQRTWGAVLDPGVAQVQMLEFANAPTPNAVSIWYHYTHAELLDGPGEGVKLFRPAAQATIKKFVDEQCWGSKYPALEGLGTYAYEIFEQTFVDAVSSTSVFGGTCPNATCTKWQDRYAKDRPHLTGAAAQVPILLLYGGADTTIAPNRMKCALDRLRQDNVQLTVCYEDAATHGGILDARADYVADWLGSVTLGEATPAACAKNDSAITVACATPPPND